MHEPATVATPALSRLVFRWRKRPLFVGLSVLLLLLFGGSFYFLVYWQELDLRAALAETEQRDPGWRLNDLEASRAVLPAEHNAALVVAAAQKLLPSTWPCWEKPYAPENNGRDPEEVAALQQSFWNLPPPVLLTAPQTALLRQELGRAAEALAEARKAAELPQGRYAFGFTPQNSLSATPLHAITTRSVAELLANDAMLHAQDQDLAGALASCRALLHTVRALGDEPLPYAIGQRMLLHYLTLQKIERILAQGEPDEASLAAVQRLLEDEAGQPLALIGTRAARAMQDAALEALQKGEVSINQVWTLLHIGLTPFASEWEQMRMRTESVKVARAALLRYNNDLVEIARGPVQEQHKRLFELAGSRKHLELPRLVRDAPTETVGMLTEALLDQAWLRSAVLMVAVERYRRAHERWPVKLADLVPDYLSAVPMDPYDGAPLRLGRGAEGVVLYSVGADGQDNGGQVALPLKPGSDMGWRLWDLPRRRQPPTRAKDPTVDK